MARVKKPDSPGPSKAYIVSFGDTMTTLLAFFIVLCSLAEEQTGANLYSGTGSFVHAMDSFGMPGMFGYGQSRRAVQLQSTSPLYIGEEPEDGQTDKNPTGPDAEDNGLRVMERQQEQFQRFLNEMERLFAVESLPEARGDATFDCYKQLNSQPPYLPDDYGEVLAHVIPLLQRADYEVELIVWATTPSPSAWERAARQASAMADEIAATARLKADQRHRLQSTARPWLFSDVQRPAVSLLVRRLDIGD